jgi:hypothetical protein
LQDVVFVQNFYKFVNIGSDAFDIRRVSVADLASNLCRVESFFKQVDNLGADHIQAKDPAVMDIQQDSAILGLRSSHCVRDLEHGQRTSQALYLSVNTLSHLPKANSTNCGYCSQVEAPASQANGTAEHSGRVVARRRASLFAFVT